MFDQNSDERVASSDRLRVIVIALPVMPERNRFTSFTCHSDPMSWVKGFDTSYCFTIDIQNLTQSFLFQLCYPSNVLNLSVEKPFMY